VAGSPVTFTALDPTGERFAGSTSPALGEMDSLTKVTHELGRFDEAQGELSWPWANWFAGYLEVKFYPAPWERSRDFP